MNAAITIRRCRVWDGIVSVVIPRNAQVVEIDLDGEVQACLRYRYSINGGCVPVFVLGDEEDAMPSQRILARVEIWKCEGCKHYIVLKPLKERKPTHTLSVVGSIDLPQRFRGYAANRILQFALTDPQTGQRSGQIILAALP